MPTSVLLAVLAAAGLLALAPALTRRYDGTERVAAERATSTARVLSRRRRRRTVPGPRPINPPRFMGVIRGGPLVAPRPYPRSGSGSTPGLSPRSAPAGATASAILNDSRGRGTGDHRRAGVRARPAPRRRPVPTVLHRRRRVLLSLVLLNVVELAGVLLVGSGFWIGFSVSFVVTLAYLVYLRRRAVVAGRLRRARLRKLAWIHAEQAAVRREHDRRAAERQAAARLTVAERDRARREAARAATDYMERYPSSGLPG